MHNILKKRTTEIPLGRQIVISILSGYTPSKDVIENEHEHIKVIDKAMYLYHLLWNLDDAKLKKLLKKTIPEIGKNIEGIKEAQKIADDALKNANKKENESQ